MTTLSNGKYKIAICLVEESSRKSRFEEGGPKFNFEYVEFEIHDIHVMIPSGYLNIQVWN